MANNKKSRVVRFRIPSNKLPSVNWSLQAKRHLRFITTTAAANNIITVGNLMDMIGVATAPTVGYRLFNQVRLKRVELWAASAPTSVSTTFAPSTVSCTWLSNSSAFDTPQVTVADTSIGSAQPAHIAASPPKLSPASSWQGTDSAAIQLFALTAPTSSVVDIYYDAILSNSSSASTTAVAYAGASAGIVYVRGLDGLASGSTVFMPLPAGVYPIQ